MKLIVGLGNPGIKYANTRHNIGFMFMDKYFAKKNISESKEKFNGLIATFKHKGENVILLKPLTYMNLSGEAVSKIAKYYNIEAKDDKAVNEFKRVAKIEENVIRELVLNLDK